MYMYTFLKIECNSYFVHLYALMHISQKRLWNSKKNMSPKI
ncbi:hypothetical protein AC51_2185 [Escherichia coli 5-172-05_S3_C3]|nr:hypothetical protein AC51_2185 [Escherichia coli 5-172-05_S3_C3]